MMPRSDPDIGPAPGSALQGRSSLKKNADAWHFIAHQGLSGLEELATQWTALAETIIDARFNHFPGWYRAHLESNRCDPTSIWFVAAYRDLRLSAVFPLQFQSHRAPILPLRFLGTVDDEELQLSDFIFTPNADNANLLCELTRWLRSESDLRWDMLRFVRIPDDSSLAYSARARPPRGTVAARYDASSYFDASGTYDQATKSMSNKFRSNLRRRSRLAENSAALRMQLFSERGELDAAFENFLDIESSGWKGPSGARTAIRCRPKVLAFYSNLVREFAARDECVVILLWHGDEAIAGQLGLHIGRTLYILKIGYRDEKSLLAPGILLQEKTLRYACEHPGIDVLHMVNDPDWLRSFRPLKVGVQCYYAPNWTARGLLGYCGVWLKRLLRATETTKDPSTESES